MWVTINKNFPNNYATINKVLTREDKKNLHQRFVKNEIRSLAVQNLLWVLNSEKEPRMEWLNLWFLCLERSIWKCNSLRTKLKRKKLRFHPFLFDLFPIPHEFQSSLSMARTQFFLPMARGWGPPAHSQEWAQLQGTFLSLEQGAEPAATTLQIL